MVTINNNIYDILIISEDYPGYGGFGTYAYNLYIQLSKYKYNIGLIYFSKSEILTDKFIINDKNIYSIHIPNFTNSINMIINNSYHSSIIENKIICQLISNNIKSAKIAISISPTALFLTNKLIETNKHIYRMGHIHFKNLNKINNLWDVDYNNINNVFIENYIADKILKNNNKIVVIPNSPMTEIFIRAIKDKLNLKNKIYFNMIGLSYDFNNRSNVEKKYDIMYATSNINRKEKNFKLVEQIFLELPFQKKIIIGHNSIDKKNIFANTELFEFLPNDELIKKMSETKILLVPSFVDAGPNVILEAILSSTIPIMAFNTGFSSLFNEKYVCQTMKKNEWHQKIMDCLNNYETLPYQKEFINIITKLSNDRKRFIETLDNYLLMSILSKYSENSERPSLKALTYEENYKKLNIIAVNNIHNIINI